MNKSSSSMNNLFRERPFSQEDEIHESVMIVRMVNQEILFVVFTRFVNFLEGAFYKNLQYPPKEMADWKRENY